MSRLTDLSERLWSLLFRTRDEREMQEELRFHLEMETTKNVEAGMTAREAGRRARLRFGGVERFKEEVRDARGIRMLDDLGRDLRHAARMLRRTPLVSATAVLMLAIGIGANTALFSAVNELLFVKLAVAEPDGLVRLRWAGENDMVTRHEEWGYSADTAVGEPVMASFSIPMFQQLSAANRTLSGLFALAPAPMLNVVVDDRAEIASGLLVSGGYFDLLGVRPRIGRAIGADDDDAATGPVAMISHAFWNRRFGQDPEVVGRVISINNVPVTIIGVLPTEYTGVRRPGGSAADIHLPLAHYAPFTSRGTERDRGTWSWGPDSFSGPSGTCVPSTSDSIGPTSSCSGSIRT